MIPGYVTLLKSGELYNRIEILKRNYENCILCPHQCGVNRAKGERGVCRSGTSAVVASYNSHHGEEPPISGHSGSGTIFFSGCTGKCIFCQNYPISQLGPGKEVTDNSLAEMMISLQKRDCHNINLVTPTHFLPSIIEALAVAASEGLQIPIVYNTSGFERATIIELLDGIIDIYLPDAKYADNSVAKEFSGFSRYVDHNRSALKEMYRQVGNLKTIDGVAIKGLIVRHLILPENLSGTHNVLEYLSKCISSEVYVSLMDQYFPAYKALNHKHLSRRIFPEEYKRALESFTDNALHNGWIQEHFAF